MKLVGCAATIILIAIASGCSDDPDPIREPAEPSGTAGGAGGLLSGAGGQPEGDGGGGAASSVGGGGAGASGGAVDVGGAGSGGASESLDDEFDDASTLAQWTLGPSMAFTAMDIATTTPGQLTVIPTDSFWYHDERAFSLFKAITGDFVMRVRVGIDSVDQPGTVPTEPYHAAGILARDPSSVSGSESWVMYDVGHQSAVTSKGTRATNTKSSASSQKLTAGEAAGELTVCRIGDTFHLLRKLDGEATWTETDTFVRADLPATLQVGVAAHANYGTPDLRATFDYARFAVPASLADCTAAMP